MTNDMKEILLTAPTGEIFVLRHNGEFYIHEYDMARDDYTSAAQRIRHWIVTENWMRVFEPGYFPLTVEDFTNLPQRI